MNMITKDYFEKQLKKREKLTVYSTDNVPHTIVKKYHLTTEPDRTMHFSLDCHDLEKYCDLMGLTLKPGK
jgi:hypothetical protein